MKEPSYEKLLALRSRSLKIHGAIAKSKNSCLKDGQFFIRLPRVALQGGREISLLPSYSFDLSKEKRFKQCESIFNRFGIEE